MPTDDRFKFSISGLASELRVVRFTAREAISELFHVELLVASEDADVAFGDAVNHAALLTMQTEGEEPRLMHGIVARFRQGEAGKKLTAYDVTVVPLAWKLLHRHDCRILQELTVPEIVERVLQGAGLAKADDYRLALQGTYPKREYCVQYRESDWAFVCRLLEEEGIYYFFEFAEDKHTLVFADKASAHAPIAGASTIRFAPPVGAMMRGEHVQRFTYAEEIRTGKFAHRDYNFEKPGLLLEEKAEAAAYADLEIYDHPGDFMQGAEGARLAATRLEERTSLRKVGEGRGSCERFAPGSLFTLSEHARDAFDRQYLITRVEHRGVEPTMQEGEADVIRYENDFHCIPSDVQFRPPLVTPRPTIKGLQSAIVVGPAGEEIYTDEHGRVKVQFHWDRLGKKDDKSSCWMRVSQVWAGEGWGAMFVPRVGHEVLVDFLDGDPDRPIVVGRVYHGTNVPPYGLPADKTKSTIKSNSTPGGGGSNELRFEDKKGSEEVYLHAQKDLTIATENDKNQSTGHDETLTVGNDRSAEVGHDQTEKIGHDESFSVGHDRKKSVGHDEAERIGHDRAIEVGNDHVESIGGAMTLSISKAKTEDVGDDSSESVGKTKTLAAGKDYAISVTGSMSTAVEANDATDVKLEKTLKVGEKITVTCGDAKITVEKSGDVTIEGAKVSVKTSGDVKVESSGKVEVKATGDVKVESSGKVEVKSSGAAEVNASGPVKLKGANVGIN